MSNKITVSTHTLKNLAAVARGFDDLCNEINYGLACEVQVKENDHHIATIYYGEVEILTEYFS